MPPLRDADLLRIRYRSAVFDDGHQPVAYRGQKVDQGIEQVIGDASGVYLSHADLWHTAPGIAANELADPPNGEHASTGESVLEELGSVGAAEPIAWVVTAAPTPRTTANAPTWPMRLA